VFQPRQLSVNVTLPAFVAERRAAALLLLDADVDRYLLPARRSAANPPRAAAAVEYGTLHISGNLFIS